MKETTLMAPSSSSSSNSWVVLDQILGSLAFLIFWLLAVFPDFPLLPIGRTAGSLLASILMVNFRVISPTDAFSSIDLSILGLLFGTMIIGAYLEKADAFNYLGRFLTWKSQGRKDLIFRVCLVSAITSAFFTNDTTCMVLTRYTLKIAAEHNLPPHPFLLALASAANIGSSATPIGNPQNLVIALKSGVSFWDFLAGNFPAAFVGVLVNAVLILCMFWRDLSSSDYCNQVNLNGEIVAVGDENGDGFSRSEMHEGVDLGVNNLRRRMVWKWCVYGVTIGMLIGLVMGMNMSWTAITAAVVLVVLDFKDAQPCLDKVSYSLLVFFCGMFMTIEGFEATGIPSFLWEVMEPYAHISDAGGLAILALVIVILSNLISNVPAVLLLGGRMAASAASTSPEEGKKAWLILAWVSTVGGNLSLVGSAANMIVCEQGRRSPHFGYDLSFLDHFIFGLPSTVIITTLGLLILNFSS